MTPYELHAGDCLEIMRGLPDGFADLTITSPPYEDARTYGIGFYGIDIAKAASTRPGAA